ncbi:MAG: hypothetical protein WC526_02275 [Patescibacteria group bacterium]
MSDFDLKAIEIMGLLIYKAKGAGGLNIDFIIFTKEDIEFLKITREILYIHLEKIQSEGYIENLRPLDENDEIYNEYPDENQADMIFAAAIDFAKIKEYDEYRQRQISKTGKDIKLWVSPYHFFTITDWKDVQIKFLNSTKIKVSTKGAGNRELTYTQLGFVTGRKSSPEPTREWLFLQTLSMLQNQQPNRETLLQRLRKTYYDTTNDSIDQTRTRLVKKLKEVFGTDEEPLVDYTVAGKIYKVKFKLLPEDSLLQEKDPDKYKNNKIFNENMANDDKSQTDGDPSENNEDDLND